MLQFEIEIKFIRISLLFIIFDSAAIECTGIFCKYSIKSLVNYHSTF